MSDNKKHFYPGRITKHFSEIYKIVLNLRINIGFFISLFSRHKFY
jgi:hypothetical protein